MELTARNVADVFADCIQCNEPTHKVIEIKGIINSALFSDVFLEEKKSDISLLCEQLHPNFMEKQEGGWSFLQACMTNVGVHWGEHPNMEKLMMLGLATGKIKYLMPRELWNALPGGMPYFVVLQEERPITDEDIK